MIQVKNIPEAKYPCPVNNSNIKKKEYKIITENDIYEIVIAENDCLVIKNIGTGRKTIFNSWLEWQKFKELVDQFENEMIPF